MNGRNARRIFLHTSPPQGPCLTLGRREAPSRGEGQARAVRLRLTPQRTTLQALHLGASVSAKGSARSYPKQCPALFAAARSGTNSRGEGQARAVRLTPHAPRGHLAGVASWGRCLSEGRRPFTPQTAPRTVCPFGIRRELPDARPGAGRAATPHAPKGHLVSVASWGKCYSVGLRPFLPQTVPRTVCRYAVRDELPNARSGAGRAANAHIPRGIQQAVQHDFLPPQTA